MTQATETNLEARALPTISGVPIGTILPYGGDVKDISVRTQLTNNGWLVCDGEAYEITAYPDLSQVIGSFFGGNLRNQFNVPDLRGRFLRGVDNEATHDPDAKSRTASADGGAIGDKVGSYQDDMMQSHKHYDPGHTHPSPSYYVSLKGNSSKGLEFTDWPGPDSNKHDAVGEEKKRGYTNIGDPVESIAGRKVTHGSENRPKNIYVNYIIKAKNVS